MTALRKLVRIGKRNGLPAALAVAKVAMGGRHAAAATFTPGDLVVSTYGTSGTQVDDGAPTPISLIEYSTSGGSAILTDQLPMTNGVNGSSNLGVVGEYGSASEGNIQLTGNDLYLSIAGYSATAAAAGIQASTNDWYGTSFPTGTGYNGNLYVSMDSGGGAFTGIWEFSGTPTGSSTPVQIIPGNNGETEGNEVFFSPEGFYFANADTLYVADTGDPKAGSPGDGGIQKWVFNGIKWSLAYTLTPTTSNWTDSFQTGFEAITGETVGTGASETVDLYAISYTSEDDKPDGLFSIDDTLDSTNGSGDTFDELETASGGGYQVFKGVSFAPESVPEPASFGILSMGSAMLLGRRRDRRA